MDVNVASKYKKIFGSSFETLKPTLCNPVTTKEDFVCLRFMYGKIAPNYNKDIGRIIDAIEDYYMPIQDLIEYFDKMDKILMKSNRFIEVEVAINRTGEQFYKYCLKANKIKTRARNNGYNCYKIVEAMLNEIARDNHGLLLNKTNLSAEMVIYVSALIEYIF